MDDSTAVAAALIGAIATLLWGQLNDTFPREMRLDITTPSTSSPLQFALSPDGRHIVFVAAGNGPLRLWVRELDRAEARPIEGTDGAQNPFWCPDSRSIAFFVGTRLQRIAIAGGSPQVVADLGGAAGFGAAWSADGTILLGGTSGW